MSGGGKSVSLDSLLNPGVRTILIKGEPGTGKTILALELLRRHGKGVYLSSRVSEERILRHHPRTKAFFEERKTASAKRKKDARFEDARLGTAAMAIESVLNAMSGPGAEEPLVVLDSWDTMARELDGVERLKAEKTLLTLADAKKASLVFVSEEPSSTTVDYATDAVVTLRDETRDGRRARRIEWNKLRGSEIPQKFNLFSLHDARFTLFTPAETRPPPGYKPKRFQPIKNPPDLYSTGSRDLDALLGGGMKRGLRMLLELGRHVGSDWHLPLMVGMSCNFILNGCCYMSIPTLGVTPERVKEARSGHLPVETLGSSLRIGHFGETQSTDRCFFQMDPSSASKSFEASWKATEEVRAGGGGERRACLMIIGMDRVEATFGNEALGPLFARGAIMTEGYGDAAVFVVKQSTKSKDMLADITDAHLKLDEIDGAPVIYAMKPPSGIYHLEYDYGRGYPSVGLTPVT
jgi:KaiC/GvpD/RAD55 family RecA-like ATPase